MISAEGKLSLEKVFESVESCLPQIEMAMQQIEAADGNLMASMGKFDTVLSGHSLAQNQLYQVQSVQGRQGGHGPVPEPDYDGQ